MALSSKIRESRSLFPVLMSAMALAIAIAVCLSIEGEFDGAVIVIPSVIIICLALITVIARNPFLFRVMIVALVVKLLATWIYTALPSFQLSDVKGTYFDSAKQLSSSVNYLTDVFSLRQLWGTNLIIEIGACLFALIGPSLAGAMVLFAIASFWGQFLFYRAFVLAFPMGNRRTAALVLFLFPSLVYWTATFGKDALMMLALGLISYGIARLFDPMGLATILIGLPLATLVRPHIGAFVVISLLLSYLVGDIQSRRTIVGLKFLLFPLFFAICLGVVTYARNSLELGTVEDAQAMSDYSYKYNQVGGSAFGDERSTQTARLVQAPFLMFRPFPWETNNAMAVIASAEGLFLLFLVVRRRVALFKLLINARSIPLVVFAISFFLIFSVVFSVSLSNFGLLARQRVMVLPLVLTLLLASKSSVVARRTIRLKDAELPKNLPCPTPYCS
jgi:hypothetical protein